MATAGNITAVLTLNSSGFQTGLSNSLKAVENFKKSVGTVSNDVTRMESSLKMLDTVLEVAIRQIAEFNTNVGNLSNFNKYAQSVNRIANALRILSSSEVNAVESMNLINNMFKYFQGSLSGIEVKVKGVASSNNQLVSSTERVRAVFTGLSTSVNPAKMTLIDYGRIEREAYLEGQRQAENLRILKREFNQLALGVEKFNAVGTGAVAKERELASASNQASSSLQRQSSASDRATASTNKQATATRGLGKAMSSLKMMTSMVGSMIAYNFVHNLAMATTETINAKSEMNGYFQMLGYTTRQTEDFNKALDNTVKKFPRLNKYALGETISSIGVEFELSTKEMKKAMPVVSMITSEYLRAGRNVNEASLAVKDILQGEFQRLSRETGVKGDQLKEAGWSGDKNDVMGLLKALEKVGKERNWDTFVQKANSLNDAVLILQNRFSEWSADMVERIQPTIVGVFNSLMTVAQNFGGIITSVADWLGGNGIGQSIVKWGGLVTVLTSLGFALIHARTGATLLQISQMGLTKTIGATILGIEAETVANNGLRDSILSSITGMEAQELAEIGRTKSLLAMALRLDMATVKEHGFIVALAESTTQIEAQKLATMGLGKQLALIGMTTFPAIAVVGAFAVALGKLALETKQATDNMAKFYDIQQNGVQHINEAKDTVKNLKSHISDLKKTQKEYTKGSEEYKNVGKAIDDLNDKVDLATQNAKDNYEALQIVNSAQNNYDTTKQELQLDLQRKINQSLVDTGLSTEEANELSNNYLNDAIDGAGQLYDALQSVSLQYSKEAGGVASLTDYWTKQGLTSEEIKVKLDPYIDSQNAVVKDIENMKLSTDLIEVASTWGKLQIDQVQLTLSENLPKIEAGDWEGGLTGMLKGLAHGLADLPIFGDFWNWVFNYTNVKEQYGGKGWEGLNQWINDSIYQISNFIFQSFSGGTTLAQFNKDLSATINDFFNNIDIWKIITDAFGGLFNGSGSGESTGTPSGSSNFLMKKIDIMGLIKSIFNFTDGIDLSWITEWINNTIIQPISTTWNNFISDPLGFLNLGSFDIGHLLSSLLGGGGNSEDPNAVDPLATWINNTIVTPLTNFASDPLGTLATWGLTLPQINLGTLIQGLFNIGGEGGFDVGAWLGSIFNIDNIVSTFTTNLGVIFTTASTIATNVSNVFSNLKSMIWNHIQGILSNVTTTFTNIKNTAVNQINGLKDGIQGGIDKVKDAFRVMKDSILNSAKLIYDGVKSKFDSVKKTIGDFWNNLTNPSSWGSAGSESYQRRSPKPQTARKMFAGSPVVRSAVHHGAGVNPYQNDSQSVKLKDLMGMIDGDNKVRLSDFLAMFSEGGFGAWDFHEPYKKRTFDTAKNYKTGSPSIKGIGTVGDGYQVGRFWNGKPSFSFEEFQAVAQAIFSAIPYKFYYDSEWKGNWVNALLSGAVNCSDGADALIALARVFGFDGYKQHTTLKNGVGHFFAVIGGKAMDTTNFQNHGSWSPLGGAGIPTRTASYTGRTGETQGKTVNVTNDFTGATIYGIDDLDSRIKESTKEAIREEFNDPFTVAI